MAATRRAKLEPAIDLQADQFMKEVSAVEVLGRAIARFAAVSGVIALLIWITWVMLDLKHLQSGFTLP